MVTTCTTFWVLDVKLVFVLFVRKIGFDISCKLSPKGDNLHEMLKPIFLENKKSINLISVERFTQRTAW